MNKKRIAFVSQSIYFKSMYGDSLKDDYDIFDLEHPLTDGDYTELIKFDADYNIFFRGEYVPNEVLNRLKGCKIALSSEPFPRCINGKWEFTLDSVARYAEFRQIRNKNFDYIFHYDKHSLKLFKKDNINISGEFLLPVDLTLYNSELNNKKKHNVFFIGRATKHRDELFDFCKVRTDFLHIAHGVQGKELVKCLNDSKICLNAHAEDEISWEPRMQMMIACGAFVLSEKILPNTYLIPGKHFIQYNGTEDLYNKIKYYLNHENERIKISNEGYKAVHKQFSAYKNFSKLINDIDNKKYDKFISGEDIAPNYYNYKESKYKHLKWLNKILGKQLKYIEKNDNKEDCIKVLNIKNSKSFKLGDLFFRSIKKPYKLITFPYNFIKILLDKY